MFDFYDDGANLHLDCASCKNSSDIKPLSYEKKMLVDNQLNFYIINDKFELETMKDATIRYYGDKVCAFPEYECLCMRDNGCHVYTLIDHKLKYLRSIQCDMFYTSKSYIVDIGWDQSQLIWKFIHPLTGHYTIVKKPLRNMFVLFSDIMVYYEDIKLKFYKIPNFEFLYEIKCERIPLRVKSHGEKYFSIMFPNHKEYYKFNRDLTCQKISDLPSINTLYSQYAFSMPYPKKLITSIAELLTQYITSELVKLIILPYLSDW